MIRRKFLLVLGLILIVVASPSANAGTMILDSFADQTTAPIVYVLDAKLLMATVNTSTISGGNDASATTVTIGDVTTTIVPADIAAVCVDYGGTEVACQANPSSLTNILIVLGGNQKGGAAFDYRVTLNSSAVGKTIFLTVESITNTILTDNIPLPQSTATRNIASSTVAPTVDTPTFASVTDTTATLGGTMSANGGVDPSACGVQWGTATGVYGALIPDPGGACTVGVAFNLPVTGLTPGVTIYYRAYATNTAGTGYSVEDNFPTPVGLPTVATSLPLNITATTADLGGDVTNFGGDSSADVGIVWKTTDTWNTSLPPTDPANGTDVPIGTVVDPIGSFVSTVGSLPTDTLVYFRAYATNTAPGTAYSGVQSFTPTAVGGPVQASSITFPRVAGKSMRISWTRGNGDGSIVVMRQDPPDSRVDPVNGDDYTGNYEYNYPPPELLPTGSLNFVVHKGSGNSVWVTGLTTTTTYSVAIYEYTGAGVSTVYLALPPEEGAQATTGIPAHNEDNRVNCSDCHGHGSFFTRNTELRDVCATCHNSEGRASAKLEFANHTEPTNNPDIDFVDCAMCHEVHVPSVYNPTVSYNNVSTLTQANKSYLRANVDKFVPTATTPAYLHTDTYDAANPGGAITPDRAVEEGVAATGSLGPTEARGYCQVCHTLTANHRSTNLDGGVPSDQCHPGAAGCISTQIHCATCHEHNNSFAGLGDCTACHNQEQPPLPRPIITTMFDRTGSSHITGGSGVVTEADCLVCHDQTGHSGDQIVGLRDLDDLTGTILFNQPDAGLATTSTGQGEVFAGNCLSCHDDGSADALAGGDAGQTPTSPFTGSGAPPIINPLDPVISSVDLGAWGGASHNRPTSGPWGTTSSVTCVGDGNNGCHGSGHGSEQLKLWAPAAGASISPAEFCFNCHQSGGTSSIDILAQFTPTTPQEYTGGGDYTTVNKQHDVLPADQAFSGATVSCKDCHSPHADNNSEPVHNPDTGASLATYDPANSYSGDSPTFTYDSGSGTDLDPSNPIGPSVGGPFAEPDYVEFCLTCHDGTVPPGVVLPPSGTLLNIAVQYATKDQHGKLIGSQNAQRGYMKTPWATQAQYDAGIEPPPYAALNCTICHGPHGSENIYNLRSSITVAGVQMQVGGITAFPGDSGTTYTLPLNPTEQEQFGWGAWCTFCHEPSHEGKGTGSNFGCSTGHTHGGGNF